MFLSFLSSPTSRMREPVFVKRFTGGMSNNTTQEESQLNDAKKTVKELRMKIDQSNSRAKTQNQNLEKAKTNNNISSGDLEVIKELEDVKQQLSKLKLDMASLLREKIIAEKEAEDSKTKAMSFSSSAKTLEKEIDEINDEQVLAELARIEALKELADIESQRKKDREKHLIEMEERKERIHLISQELDGAKVLETQLAVTLADVYMMENELKQIKPDSVHEDRNLITKEIETAKNELASVREEGFRIMASMNVLRTEFENVSEEATRLKKREEKIELAIQNMNSKVLRGRAKLKAASLSEETANSTLLNLSNTLDQYKTEIIAAKKEVLLIKQETQKIKQEIDQTESQTDAMEGKLQTAIEELKSIKSSEAKALENLKTLAENTMKNRASAFQHSSVLAISKFEYQYLKDRAARAEEIADKKVAAAQAWIEAIKASEREILMEMEKVKKESLEAKKVDHEPPRSHPETEVCENEMDIWMQNYDKNTVDLLTKGSSSTTTSGKPTPIRRGKHRVSMSKGISGTSRSSASFSGRRRIKVMPNLAKLFTGKNDDRNA